VKIKLWPRTKEGKSAAYLALTFVLLMILKFFTYSISLPTPVIAGVLV